MDLLSFAEKRFNELGPDTEDQQQQKRQAIICHYHGIERRVHPEVCKWHLEEQDPQCLKCNGKSQETEKQEIIKEPFTSQTAQKSYFHSNKEAS